MKGVKLCPFCGRVARVSKAVIGGKDKWNVYCPSDADVCPAPQTGWNHTRKESVDFWNIRYVPTEGVTND